MTFRHQQSGEPDKDDDDDEAERSRATDTSTGPGHGRCVRFPALVVLSVARLGAPVDPVIATVLADPGPVIATVSADPGPAPLVIDAQRGRAMIRLRYNAPIAKSSVYWCNWRIADSTFLL